MSIARDTKPCNQSVSARPKFHAGKGLCSMSNKLLGSSNRLLAT
jgi:hypothetical protein